MLNIFLSTGFCGLRRQIAHFTLIWQAREKEVFETKTAFEIWPESRYITTCYDHNAC